MLPNTSRAYDRHWNDWKAFLKDETNQEDPFLRDLGEGERASLVGLLMLRRHQPGMRGKRASAFTAGVRLRFAQQGAPTTFLDAAIVATARAACKLKPEELRAIKDRGASASVKLPICEEILTEMRSQLWTGRAWSGDDLRARMTYLGCTWGFEMGARVSEYTVPEPGAVDHCIRLDDLVLVVVSPTETKNIVGSELAATGLESTAAGRRCVVECRALAASSKGKVAIKPKILGRRSLEEIEFLEDLMAFIVRSGATGKEELFSFHPEGGKSVRLRSRAVRDQLKDTCSRNGLDPDYFSSHSLRKGAITQMRSLGASEDDRRDRGSYAPNSQVMNCTYDYGTGLGPLASNRLVGGHKPVLADLKRLMPPARTAVP